MALAEPLHRSPLGWSAAASRTEHDESGSLARRRSTENGQRSRRPRGRRKQANNAAVQDLCSEGGRRVRAYVIDRYTRALPDRRLAVYFVLSTSNPHTVVVIPKSKTPDRIAANIDVDGFALTADEMAAIDALGS